MITRCYRPTNENYHRYGGRGITVCDRWRNNFQAFFDDMGVAPQDTELDRKDNDGNYEPSNCRWATKSEQARNRSKRKPLLYDDPSRCIRLNVAGTFSVRVRLHPNRRIQRTFSTLDEAREFLAEIEYEREFQRALGLF